MLVSGEKTLLIDNLSHVHYAKGADIYLHTELKVAVRTCEGKAMHRKHRKVSTYLPCGAISVSS